jgi:hypothetical protein
MTFQVSDFPSYPRKNGDGVMFSVSNAGEPVLCIISRVALEEITHRRHIKPSDVLACFKGASAAIHALALKKLQTRPESVSGCLRLWTDDLDDEPPISEPGAAPPNGNPQQLQPLTV